jgi:hypothetical protein
MNNQIFNEIERRNIQSLFALKSTNSLYIDAQGVLTTQATLRDKIIYFVKYIFSFGIYSVKNTYRQSLRHLINTCQRIGSDESITFQNNYRIFKELFPENLVTKESFNRAEKNQAKQVIHQLLNQIQPLYGQTENAIQQLKDLNQNPRLAEAHYCLAQKNKKVERANHRGTHLVFRIYNRSGKKILGIFKQCEPHIAKMEEEISNKLGSNARVNQKQSAFIEFSIPAGYGIKREFRGLFQKFIKGDTLNHLICSGKDVQFNDRNSIDQLHYIAIFDLLNFNHDRHANNLMLDRKKKIWAIDNELDGREVWSYHQYWGGCKATHKTLNEPFSQYVKNYILFLARDQIISSSLSPEHKKRADFYLQFLKSAISHDPCPTLVQIFGMLKTISQLSSKTQEQLINNFKTSDFQSFITILLKERINGLYSSISLEKATILKADLSNGSLWKTPEVIYSVFSN